MHILFFAPYFNQPRGNSTTIKRLVHNLHQHMVSTSVIPYLEQDDWHFPNADIYHILHATRFVKWAKDKEISLDRPYIVTMGGTDINVDLQKGMEEDVFSFLDRAAFITVFTDDAKDKVIHLHPTWEQKTFVISQGIWLPWNLSPLQETLSPRILLPAGLRPVKDVLHILPALDQLIGELPHLNFTILGAKLDEEVYKNVKSEADSRPWMTYAGVVPYEVMRVWYDQTQIVINTSLSEGQSLAIMEAMAAGRPVIARKNEANMQLIQHGRTGCLYETMSEFIEAVQSIVNDVTFRHNVIKQAKQWMDETCSSTLESEEFLKLYRLLTN